MEKRKIFVVGSGKLASAVLSLSTTYPSGEVLKWDSEYLSLPEKVLLIHAGSGRQLNECFEFCSRTKSTLIELSTGLETEIMQPDFPLILCPNTSLLVLKMMSVLKANGHHFEGFDISITESHQAAKKTEPGTAYSFADSLKLSRDKVVSTRDTNIQEHKIGIPPAYLDKHAYHRIEIKDGNDEVVIETRVLGHDSYAKGVKAIIEAVSKQPLENRKYSVLELIDKQLL
ncbi:hypothetical protein Palpr_0778 [Paludibacter propionicigenes WB4]|uniref:Dihydrodipicolinate reductase C-terminal domain-containing protein n=1 Tax=Paludibacter propionicigenes (strain DSM 17365 / JCM 13257 / WB4) TaxID=694427 RepID=E4T2I8_PALPW|nr:dihydrodipicolinate reductase C-terminal domain-containing protein [Paludibacter propionicigenes]ADQ78932.1 hypothetical protein Palpr_0778 [Paludibacter propionicigenes WB4]